MISHAYAKPIFTPALPPPPTDLDVALVAAGDEVLLCGIERHAFDGCLVGCEPVPHLTPPHVEDAHAAPLTARDQQLDATGVPGSVSVTDIFIVCFSS